MMPQIDTYPQNSLPPGFHYPPRFLQVIGGLKQDSYYPWFFFRAQGEVGQLRLSLGMAAPKKLVPFASLESGDGDVACFDGTDTSGNPAVIMMITDGSGRHYGFVDFDDWLARATADSNA